jgi:hypothetical protein
VNYQSRVYDRKTDAMLDWKAIDVDTNRFILRPWAVDILGSSPQEKQDGIDWMRANGLLTDRAATLDLINSPDLDKWVHREVSGIRFIEEEIEEMLDGGEYRGPPSEVDLEDLIPRVQEMILEAFYDKREPANIKKAQDWIRAAQRMEAGRKARQAFQQKIAAQNPAALNPAAPDAAALGGAPGMPQLPGVPSPDEPLIPPNGAPPPGAPMLQ